mgnify:CR=1 FL=1
MVVLAWAKAPCKFLLFVALAGRGDYHHFIWMLMSVQSNTTFFRLTKDLNASLIMSQIYYWYLPSKNGAEKRKVRKRGADWIVKNHHQWFEETCLTRRQVDRALGILVNLGYLVSEVHRFGSTNSPTRHLRCPVLEATPLNSRATLDLDAVFSKVVPPQPKPPKTKVLDKAWTGEQQLANAIKCASVCTYECNTNAPECANTIAPTSAFFIQETKQENKQETKTQNPCGIVAGGNQSEIQGEFKDEVEKTDTWLEGWTAIPELPGMMEIAIGPVLPCTLMECDFETDKGMPVNADEIMAGFKASKHGGLKTNGTGVNALAMLWKKRVALEGQYAKPLTAKEVGQLKHVHKALGDSALSVLDHALGDWQAFALEASVQSGCTPAMAPTTGFFCLHYAVAVNQLEAKNAPVVPVPKIPKITQSIAPKSATAQTGVCDNQHHDPKATTSDVQATLAALASIVAANGNT